MERSTKLKRRRWRHGGTGFIMFSERTTFTYLLAFVRPLLLFWCWAERCKGVWVSGCWVGGIPPPQAVRLLITEADLSVGRCCLKHTHTHTLWTEGK